MKQTKKLTYRHRTILMEHNPKIKDTTGYRFIKETKNTYEFLDPKGTVIIIEK